MDQVCHQLYHNLEYTQDPLLYTDVCTQRTVFPLVDDSIDEMTLTFRPASEVILLWLKSIPNPPHTHTHPQILDSHGRRLSEFLDEQWPLSHAHCTTSLSSSKEDLALQLELELQTSVITFKGADWQATPTHSDPASTPTAL